MFWVQSSDYSSALSVVTKVSTPGYSVVIPAHNAAGFIRASIASVQAQTRKPERILVVDDGSTDDTAALARAAGADVVSKMPAQGVSSARNSGVDATTSPLLAFLDADDEWIPGHAEEILQAFQYPGVVFASSRARTFGAAEREVPIAMETAVPLDIRDALLAGNPVVQSGVMIQRTAFDRAGRYTESMRHGEDYDLWQRVAPLGDFLLTNSPTVRYRIHDRQVSQLFRSQMVEGAWAARRTGLQIRLASDPRVDARHLYRLLRLAWRNDIETIVGEGRPDLLPLVRAEVARTVGFLVDFDASIRFVAEDSRLVRLVDAARCRGRAIARRITR